MKRAVLSLFLFFFSFGLFLATPAFFAVSPPGTVYADVTGTSTGSIAGICNHAGAGCQACFNSGGAWTELGCIGAGGSPEEFLKNILTISIGIGGGVAFLLILFSGFQTMISAGNPEKLHEAKELMTAAISGLLLIIFSVFLLKLIGVDILQLPGFGGGGSSLPVMHAQ